MIRTSTLILGLLVFTTPALGQTTSTDSQTLQALLAEVRQLRRDLQTTTIAAQRAQILLYRLQIQEAIVARVSRRLEDTREELARLETEQKKLGADIKRLEDFVSNTDNSPADRKQSEDILPQLKTRLESLENQEQLAQTKEAETQEQQRLEQVKLESLQNELERLEKTLKSLGEQAGANQH
jgi:chromosome segregation ATPase